MTSVRRGVLLDLDGTLVDSNYLHTLAWWRALVAAGEAVTMNAVHRLIGMGGDQLLPALIGRFDDGIEAMRNDEYAELMPEVRPFRSAPELVAALHATGVVTVLATSSPSADVDRMVELLGIDEQIDARTTVDDVRKTKPDPEIFTVAMRKAGLEPADTVALGDSRWDVEAAIAAGVPCVAVETGGTSRAELLDAGAVAVYVDTADLLDHLFESPLARLLTN